MNDNVDSHGNPIPGVDVDGKPIGNVGVGTSAPQGNVGAGSSAPEPPSAHEPSAHEPPSHEGNVGVGTTH